MTRPLLRKVKPASGVSNLLHTGLLLVLPVVVFVLIQLNLVPLALATVVLSKWRMFAVRPRFWAANIRANSVDLMVGMAIVIFMTSSDQYLVQLGWAVIYSLWLVLLKPRSGIPAVTAQAFVGQLAGLMALYLAWDNAPLAALTILTGLICYLAARHLLDGFDEPYARMLAYVWGYFAAALAWLSGHWLLFYSGVAQPTLLLTTIGYGLAVLYYLDHHDRLSKGMRRQFIFIMVAIVLIVIRFSDWGDKVV